MSENGGLAWQCGRGGESRWCVWGAGSSGFLGTEVVVQMWTLESAQVGAQICHLVHSHVTFYNRICHPVQAADFPPLK